MLKKIMIYFIIDGSYLFTDIKLKNWNKAVEDCTAVLQIEPDNLKGETCVHYAMDIYTWGLIHEANIQQFLS